MNRDSRLQKAYAAVDEGRVKVLSLDIFDTLVWRKVPHFEDLFLILGKRLQQEGWLIPAVNPETFASLRLGAESRARMEKEYLHQVAEVTVPEIYWRLQHLFPQLTTEQMLAGHVKGIYEGDVTALVHEEFLVEKELVRLDLQIVQLLHYAKSRNIPVVLVSDTYWEEKEVRDLISDLPIDHFFLSCEYGCGKQKGLFQYVLETLRVPPHEILHIGDHPLSDVEAAAAEGISVLHFPKYETPLKEVMEHEWTHDLSKRTQLLDLKQGDFGISALRAKIAHHTDLSRLKRRDQFFWKYGATVLGPLLAGFVHWIYARCHAMGESRLFCLMREGELYARLIQAFAPYYPQHTLEAKQLWVSRLFIAHTAVGSGNRKELVALLRSFLEQYTVETVCTYLGLDLKQMRKWAQYRHVMLEDPTLRGEFLNDLLGREELRKQIVLHAAAKRKRFLNYLSQLTNLSSPSQMTLVDIGWNGSAQGALQKVLQVEHIPIQLHGLYVGTTENIHPGFLEGVVREGYLLRGGYPHFGNSHKKGCFVLEQTATATTGVGPLADIDEEGKIITNPSYIPAKQKREAEIVQQGIMAFFEQIGTYIQAGAVDLNAHSEQLHNQLRALFLRSMTNATQEEAEKFGPWFHEHAPARHLTQVIGKHPYYENFIQDMLPSAALKESGLNWLSAYTAKKSKYLTLAMQAVWLETLPPQCFLSEDDYSLQIFLDTGAQFPEKPYQHIEMRSNPNRNFFTLAKIFSAKKPIQRIQLKLAFASSLVRVKSLRLLAYDRTTADPHHFTFFETEETPPPECLSGTPLDRNTYYCDDHLALVHTLPPHIYHIKLKLCCEMFPM